MLKRLISLLLVAALLLSSSLFATPANAKVDESNAITVKVDNLVKTFDQPPVLLNNRALVPMRGIFEMLGAQVDWAASTSTVTAKLITQRDPISVVLQVGNPVATVNNTRITLDQAPEVVNGRTMVPVRFVSETLRAAVNWTEQTNTVEIYSLDYQLLISAIRGHLDLVDKLLDLGANPSYLNRDKGDTPLTAAALLKQNDIVLLMVNKGANVNAQDADGYTALMMAVNNEDAQLVSFLLDHGADPDLESRTGFTALQLATQHQNQGLVSALRKVGATK